MTAALTDPFSWPEHPMIATLRRERDAAEAKLSAVTALADWLAAERDRTRAAYREHNAGRMADKPERRPDLATWANAYEVAERHLRAVLEDPS